MDIETPLPTLDRIPVAMNRTGLSRTALYRLIGSGQLKVVKIGRSVRVSEQELSRFINALGA